MSVFMADLLCIYDMPMVYADACLVYPSTWRKYMAFGNLKHISMVCLWGFLRQISTYP